MKLNIFLLYFGVTKIAALQYHMDKYSESRYNMILGRDILLALVLNLKIPKKSREVTYCLKGAQHPWLIWLYTSLKF